LTDQWCESCGKKMTGPFLEAPPVDGMASTMCLPCVQEALEEHRKRETERGVTAEPRIVLQDGSEVSWNVFKRMAAKDHVWFQIPDNESGLSFRMGPDHFPGSFVLAWLTLEEKAGGPDAYRDNRCRSNEPDDFLSRIEELTVQHRRTALTAVTRVYFAGVTGPEASGGIMGAAFVVCQGNLPVAVSAICMDAGHDASWHSATYHALTHVFEEWGGRLPAGLTELVTDNEFLVKQMNGLLGVKGGHYVEAREDALGALARAFPQRGATPLIFWVPREQNLAVPVAEDMLLCRGIEIWSYKKQRDHSRLAFL